MDTGGGARVSEYYEVRYKKIMVESVKVYARSPEQAMELVEEGHFSSDGATIHNRYPFFEAILVEDGHGKITKKEG